jgi:hypothetical protein
MSDEHLSSLAARIAASRRVSEDDVLAMRRIVYSSPIVSEQDAHLITMLDDQLVDAPPSWSTFLSELVCDYLVHQELPEGYVNEAKAQWLIQHISANGFLKSDTELELLINVMECARRVPHALTAFALAQVKIAVLDGEGPLAHGGILQQGKITIGEVNLLRRILSAASGEAQIAISRHEAEVLFELHDATCDADNDPEWNTLFIQSIAQYLMSLSLHEPPTFEEALRREKWLMDQKESVNAQTLGGFFGRMFSGSLSAFQHSQSEANYLDRSSATATAEKITQDEAVWLIDRIMQDGQVSMLERQLLAYIHQSKPPMQPTLENFIQQVA